MIYAKYPMLRGARTLATAPNTTELKYRETTFEYFNRMLLGPYHETQTDRIQVHLFLNSIVLLKKINSSFVSRKFITSFAKVFESNFLHDLPDRNIREEILDFFDLPPEYQSYKHEIVAMSIPHYFEFVRGVQGAEFRLVNQAVNKGTVTISNRQFVLALRTKLTDILLKKIQDMKSVDQIYIDDDWIFNMRQKYRGTDIVAVNAALPGTMPPCMKAMVDKAHSSHHLSHVERVTLGIYLKSKNYPEDFILDIYRDLSDWNERITKYQLGRLDRYQCYGCEKMVTEGLCRKEEDTMQKCSHIRNPFLY